MRLKLAAAVLLAAMLGGACGGGEDSPRISTKRVGLELAFKGGEGAKEGRKQKIVVVQPALNPAGIVPRSLEQFVPPPPPSVPVQACPKAPAGAGVGKPVTVAIHALPKTGFYTYANTGKGEVEQGGVRIGFPYPYVTERQIRNVKRTGDGFTFEAFQRGLTPDVTQTIHHAVTPTALQITKLVQTSSEGTATIQPTPAVTLMTLNRGEGATWNSVGVDTNNGTVLQIEGRITKREIVDVCGKLYDSFRVESKETFFNSFSGYRYRTDEDHPTIYNVATHLGGIFLREDVKSTAVLPTSSGPVTLRLDYTSLVQSVKPRTS